MKITSVEIRNYRRLEAVKIELSADTTLLVGPNNSGKSSAILALHSFLQTGKRFKVTDITLKNLAKIGSIGAQWTAVSPPDAEEEASGPSMDALIQLLPSLDVWISADESELGRVPQVVPLLAEFPGHFGVRLALQPRDREGFRGQYVSDFEKAAAYKGEHENLRLRPTDLVQYMETRIDKDFEVVGYLLNDADIRVSAAEITGIVPLAAEAPGVMPGVPEGGMVSAILGESNDDVAVPASRQRVVGSFSPRLLRSLVRVDLISATRGLTDADADGTSSRLSGISGSYFFDHLQDQDNVESSDLNAILANQMAIDASNELAKGLFRQTLDEIRSMGYPGGGDPGLLFESNMAFETPVRPMFLRHQVGVDSPTSHRLDESLNGLGYQSLIYMMFSLMGFRQSRLKPTLPGAEFGVVDNAEFSEEIDLGVPPVHLVLIEEPEAFLHAQVQQVFIKHALRVLRKNEGGLGSTGLQSQLVVSTHSSHIVQEVPFSSIRYIRREVANDINTHPVSTVVNLTDLIGSTTDRFVKRFVEITHCNMFFADALILIEGAAERILLPEMISRFRSINAGYVELLQIRGSHAHKIRKLVEVLGVPTLIITDIDAMKPEEQKGLTKAGEARKDIHRKTRPALGDSQVTGNPTLKTWLNAGDKIDVLASLAKDAKVVMSAEGGFTRFAFQKPLSVDPSVIPSTFEDALALENSALLPKLQGGGALLARFVAAIRKTESVEERAELFFEEIKNADKAEFALDLLDEVPDGTELAIPGYIVEGLEWLDEILSRRGLLALDPIVLPVLISDGAQG